MSSAPEPAVANDASQAPLRAKQTGYPQPFAARVAGREKRPLGDLFGLTNFGVNLTRLAPGCVSSIRHTHTKQDEFIYVLRGHPVLVTDGGETELAPGMCAGFAAGSGDAHQLVNPGPDVVEFLEIGDRTPGDDVQYPDDDLAAKLGADGKWHYYRKDGTAY
jgi:uncharacterized cupin superfamily protein